MNLLIASHNVHKIREIRSILKKMIELDVYSLLDFPSYEPLPEEELSLEKNAENKAIRAAKATGMLALADDSGLIVPILGGRPGAISARFAGPGATDRENRQKLLEELQPFPLPEQRQAYFECWMALADSSGLKKTAKGTCEGVILDDEKGGQGFGYDPLFLKHEYSKTFAEMDTELKNRISHRNKALEKIVPVLKALITSSAV